MARWSAVLLVALFGLTAAPAARAASTEELEAKLKALETQVDALKKEMRETKTPPPPPPAAAPAAPESPAYAPAVAPSGFRLGGYGSTRLETSDLDNLNNTFTFRRFVLTGDAAIGERLRGLVELEVERLTELEVERRAPVEAGRRGFSQSIEGSDSSEISLEQAWVQFELAEWARFRAGTLLVPLGRFNINHDDNRWELPRRSLVDRGVSVLPAKAAWSEVGMGFAGDFPAGEAGKLSYEVYVLNGVALDSSIETVARGSGELETEVEIRPRRGTANLDLKRDKAGALRLAWSPALGQEVGTSVYYGRYTPDFLPSEPVWGVGIDGKLTLTPFEIEGEYVRTRFEGIGSVARGFARAVADKAVSTGTSPLEATIEFELAGLATTKQGYWIDLRYRFWPDFLRDTFLGRRFENPQLILTLRGEQVWLDGLVSDAEFAAGTIERIVAENRWVDRATLGLAYRPVPLVVFQTAFERTWTNSGQSLAAVTNFLPAKRTEDAANSFLFGVAFGF